MTKNELVIKEAQELADLLGIPLEQVLKNQDAIQKKIRGVKQAGAQERAEEEQARIDRELGLGGTVRDMVANYLEEQGPIERGTQLCLYFTARKDGTDSTVVKINAKGEQSARWYYNNGDFGTDIPQGFKREKKEIK